MENAIADDQSEVAAFLSDPATHGLTDGTVDRIDTHAAMVFLAGDRAYKVKRAVRFPYLDFSTLALRRRACAREIELNRRTAPGLYLEAAAIVRGPDHRLAIAGPSDTAEGEVVEWAVVMTRFDQGMLLDRLARDGLLTDGLIEGLADEIARFHRAAEVVGEATGNLVWAVEETLEELEQAHGLFSVINIARFATATRAKLSALESLLARRQAEGHLRRCHGDLHLGNIVAIEGAPVLFDCIEFNDRIACIDVIYDLAFLLMDLVYRDQREAANRLFNRYLERTADLSGLAALPLFLATRAAIRAKVHLSAADQLRSHRDQRAHRGEAASYLELAEAVLDPAAASLIAIGGRSGSGKTRLARALAPGIGAAPGALVLRSDQIRKAAFEADELTRLGPEAYAPEVSRRVYDRLRRDAREALASDHAVIADATFMDPEDRRMIEAVARDLGAAFHGLWLEASAPTLEARVAQREHDASDATPAVVQQQLDRDIGRLSWHSIDSDRPLSEVLADAVKRIKPPAR